MNQDNYCFVWSIVAALYPCGPEKLDFRTSSYPHPSSVLSYTGIEFPMSFKNIPYFEKLNNLSINVYGIESEFSNSKKKKKSIIIPIHLSKFKSEKETIHLLMVEWYISQFDDDLEKIKPRFHFALILDLSRLVRSQVTESHNKHFICNRCLNHFKLEKSYENHENDCYKINKARMILPDAEHKILKFKNFQKKDTVPFVVYADLECILAPMGDDGTQDSTFHTV
ncbi:GSCOCG00010918001-RA-CDS [Cotesia congregata]|nr:GSCOCG00010918001-RA-CDS [Cotesia congregata]